MTSLRELPAGDVETVLAEREAARQCLWCGAPLPAGSRPHRHTCSEPHQHALSRWRRGPRARVLTCRNRGTPIDRTGVAGNAPILCDQCRPRRIPPQPPHPVGTRFGRYTLLEYTPSLPGLARARFRCDCGRLKELQVSNVASGRVTDCGDRMHPRPDGRV